VAYNESIRLKPDTVDAHIHIAIAYSYEKRPDDAIKALREAIRLQPDSDVAYHNLGMTYLEVKNKSQAMEQYRQLQRLKSELAAKLLDEINSR